MRGWKRPAEKLRREKNAGWERGKERAASGTHDTRRASAPGKSVGRGQVSSGYSAFRSIEQEEKPVSEVKVSFVPQEVSSQEARKSRNGSPLRIALFGFGTVASSVARILVESKPQGLELTHIYSRSLARRRADWVPSSVIWSDNADAVLASDVDVVVELAGGLEPAGGWVRRGLEAGKSARLTRSEEHTSELQSLRQLVCR